MFYKTNPNSIFLHTCIHVFLHTCFLPNEPNPVHPVNPVKIPNKPNFNTIYLCNLCNLWFLVLQNKPNFPIFDLKMRVSAENKPNSNAGSWPLAAILP
jgi:hypothetical protein